MNNKTVHMVAFILLVVGGLNGLFVALFNLDIINMVLGSWPMLIKVFYVLVGLGAIYEIVGHKGRCTMCGS